MSAEGTRQLTEERIPEARRRHDIKFDCRYIKQYHEVSFLVPRALIDKRDVAAIARLFHDEHNRLYGYSLEQENAPIEVINVRVQSIGFTDKPTYREEAWAGADASKAVKGRRSVYIPETKTFREVPIYDGHKLRFGNRVEGPAMIEEETTAIFVSDSFDGVVDALGSFLLFRKGREELIKSCLRNEKVTV
ncbi:MAG: hypothetical protein L6Q52_04115 [Rhodocyclaceae bacterium]|nr:hypothetical protein [Rhodocyclaceae bacterium]